MDKQLFNELDILIKKLTEDGLKPKQKYFILGQISFILSFIKNLTKNKNI